MLKWARPCSLNEDAGDRIPVWISGTACAIFDSCERASGLLWASGLSLQTKRCVDLYFELLSPPMRTLSLSTVVALLVSALVLAGCGESDPSAPPSDWETNDDRWWTADADTAEAFRDLSDLQAMGVFDEEEAEDLAIEDDQVSGEQFIRGVKQGLNDFYQSNPQVIDELFEEYARPELGEEARSGDVEDLVQEAVQDVRNLLDTYYQRPQLEGSPSVTYPRALHEEGVSGTVVLQVRVNSSGEPVAVRVLESVHPELDAIAMRAVATMEATPARVRYSEDDEWEDIEGWIHFDLPFHV